MLNQTPHGNHNEHKGPGIGLCLNVLDGCLRNRYHVNVAVLSVKESWPVFREFPLHLEINEKCLISSCLKTVFPNSAIDTSC